MVDKSLSRGLADRVLDELKGLAEQYVAGCREAIVMRPHKRSSIEATIRKLTAVGQRCLLTQFVGGHPRWRWAATCAFVPHIDEVPKNGSNRAITFRAARTYLHVDRFSDGGIELAPILLLQEHAIERLFLRLNVLEASAVREEIHDAMCLSVPVQAACAALDLKQVVLPTQSGAFLCSIEDETLVAKTWISTINSAYRHSPVANAIRVFYTAVGGDREVGAELISFPYGTPLVSMPANEKLIAVLSQYPWLREAYVPRPDPVGDTWRHAEEQAMRAS